MSTLPQYSHSLSITQVDGAGRESGNESKVFQLDQAVAMAQDRRRE